MSRNIQKKGSDDGYSSGDFAYYLYCIVERVATQTIGDQSLPAAIEDDSTIELVDAANLSAIVSRVPLATYGDESLTQNLADASWMAVRAMKHERVVEHFARSISVVPLRFGTVYLDRAGITRMLSEKQTELSGILDRLRGREEWGVNVYFDRTKLLESITSVSPVLKDLSQKADAAAPGQSYLLRKKIEALRVDEVRSEINRIIDELEKKIDESSDEIRRLRMLKVESTEHGELKAKFAALIPRSDFNKFHATVEQLAKDYESAGMRLELTGPWPAYNFT